MDKNQLLQEATVLKHKLIKAIEELAKGDAVLLPYGTYTYSMETAGPMVKKLYWTDGYLVVEGQHIYKDRFVSEKLTDLELSDLVTILKAF